MSSRKLSIFKLLLFILALIGAVLLAVQIVIDSTSPQQASTTSEAFSSGGIHSQVETITVTGDDTAGEDASNIEESYTEKGYADIYYYTPIELELGGDPEEVGAYISYSKTLEEVKAAFESENRKIEGDKIEVSSVMEAELIGAAFNISPSGPVREAINVDEENEWYWEVTAKQAGEQNLTILIRAVYIIDGIETPDSVDRFVKTIPIKVNQTKAVKEFISQHWEWFWAVLIVPLFVTVNRRLRGKQVANSES